MTKIIMLVLCMLLCRFAAIGQITKNNWMLGGAISYASTNYNSINFGVAHTTYNLEVKPNVGYFFIDKLSAGLRSGIGIIGDRSRGQSYTDFNIGPYVRYYLLNAEKYVNIITEAGYLYGFEKERGPEKTPKNTFCFSAGPVLYFNTIVGLEMLLSYSTYKYSGLTGRNNTITVGLGLQIHLEKEE